MPDYLSFNAFATNFIPKSETYPKVAPLIIVYFAIDNYLRICGKQTHSMVLNITVLVTTIKKCVLYKQRTKHLEPFLTFWIIKNKHCCLKINTMFFNRFYLHPI